MLLLTGASEVQHTWPPLAASNQGSASLPKAEASQQRRLPFPVTSPLLGLTDSSDSAGHVVWACPRPFPLGCQGHCQTFQPHSTLGTALPSLLQIPRGTTHPRPWWK